MLGFAIGLIVGIACTMLALIVFAPWRRVRSEPPLPLETQLRLLLGLDPEGGELTAHPASTDPDWRFDPAQIEALRDLDGEPPTQG